jgi:endonuclease/exonuclease/phosphatase family metal-dependent hydrolase
MSVYGPTLIAEKAAFLDELRSTKLSCPGPSLYCGDFNMIYRDQDKNDGALHRSWMRRFRRVIDDLQLVEVYLHGQLYTWSNERRRPTMERLDRVLATSTWLDTFTNHYLVCLSTDCSDHAPLSLRLDALLWAKLQFHFESFWTSMDGFSEVVSAA